MSGVAFIKVIMLTGFLYNGGLYEERVETTLTLCEQAREEATRFNNRFLWPWNEDTRSWNRIFVTCLYHPDTKEV